MSTLLRLLARLTHLLCRRPPPTSTRLAAAIPTLPPLAALSSSSSVSAPSCPSLCLAYVVVAGGSDQAIGGTSASCPIVAGIFTLLNDYALTATGKPLGPMNPLLYTWGYQNPDAYQDVTVGDNACTERYPPLPSSSPLLYHGLTPLMRAVVVPLDTALALSAAQRGTLSLAGALLTTPRCSRSSRASSNPPRPTKRVSSFSSFSSFSLFSSSHSVALCSLVMKCESESTMSVTPFTASRAEIL